MNEEIKYLSESMLSQLEEEMRLLLKGDNIQLDPFYGMMQYHLGWVDEDFLPITVHGGKRIRPLLTMLSCKASGGNWRKSVPASVAVEILHNFSLIHDDIEDISPTRRGRKTVWKIWGKAQAINSGDAMFSLAQLAMIRLAESDISPNTIIRALRRFNETCLMLTKGQYEDMSFESRKAVAVNEYIDMINGKTAVLLALCAELGALIAEQDDDSVNHYSEFGRNLGLAFQVIDDILGIWGEESKTGKSAATDIITKKKTLPVLYGLEKSDFLRELYRQAPADEVFVNEVVNKLDEVGAREYASELAFNYSAAARRHLQEAKPAGEAGVALIQLADMLLQRDY